MHCGTDSQTQEAVVACGPEREACSNTTSNLNLHLVYQACDMVKVDCGHIFICGDKYAVVRSTIKEAFTI